MTINCIKCSKPLGSAVGVMCFQCKLELTIQALPTPKQVVWEGAQDIIPLAKVQYVDKNKDNTHAWVIMDGTTYNPEADCYNNAPYLVKEELADFIEAWKNYLK